MKLSKQQLAAITPRSGRDLYTVLQAAGELPCPRLRDGCAQDWYAQCIHRQRITWGDAHIETVVVADRPRGPVRGWTLLRYRFGAVRMNGVWVVRAGCRTMTFEAYYQRALNRGGTYLRVTERVLDGLMEKVVAWELTPPDQRPKLVAPPPPQPEPPVITSVNWP